jgi:hypothetical protein
MAMSRVPFEHTLVDRRHQAFVDGERNLLLSPAQLIGSRGFILAIILGVGLLVFLRIGIGGLLYDFSVRNDWVTTDATIVSIVPMQSGDHFNWWYLYTFQTEDGEQGSGKVVEDGRDAFHEGQSIAVRYLRTNPGENVYAHEKMPKSVLYWVSVGLGARWVGVAGNSIRRIYLEYRALRAISRLGQAVRGEITGVPSPARFSSNVNVELEYVFTSPAGTRSKRRDAIAMLHLTGTPEPGTAVAVWCVGDEVALLL